MNTLIKCTCPECQYEFNVDIDKALSASIEKELRRKVESDFNLKLKEKDDQLRELEFLKLQNSELESSLNAVREKALLDARRELVEKEAQIKAEAEKTAQEKFTLDLMEKENDMKKQLEDVQLSVKRAAIEAAEKVRDEERMKIAELQEKLDVQRKLAEDMKRKAEQGSMQSQGEIQELELERVLRESYPYDTITEVKKGARGADVLQLVRSQSGLDCGQIYYESKRTKDYQKAWISKLKEDNLQMNADILVLATEVMPEGKSHFFYDNGVWICPIHEVKALSLVLRVGLLEMQQLRIAQHGRESKAELLYNFIMSNEFKGQLEAIINGFSALRDSYHRERSQMQRLWKEREKQLELILSNAAGFYGSLKGIGGSSVPEMKMLEAETEEISGKGLVQQNT
jgi:hypothetical protein